MASNATTIEDLEDKLVKLNEHAKAIIALADAEDRDLSDAEQRDLDATKEAFLIVEKDIQNRRDVEEQEAKLARPQARVVRIDPPEPPAPEQQAAEQRRLVPARRFEQIETKGSWGWRSFGEFASAVRTAQRGKIDPRLIANAAPTSGSEGTNADGGYAIPPDFRAEIMVKVMGEQSLMSRTDQQTTSSNQITVPIDETTSWAASGGLQVAWESELGQHAQSKPALGQVTVRAYKLAALVPVTDELLEDVSALANYLRRKVPEKFVYKLNDAIINGTGTGQPLGLLNSAAKVALAKGSQSADTVTFPTVTGMWARMYGPWRNNAVWLINQDVEPQLQQMIVGGSTTAVPAYMPPGGLSGSQYATLMGRPVIVTEACAALGDEGDIILTDLSQYLSVVKASGLRQDVSIHLWFDYDVTAFRFVMRMGGQPWWSAAITRAHGSNTLSSIVTAAAR